MTGSRFIWLALSLVLALRAASARPVKSDITISPAVVVAGSPEVIEVNAPSATLVSGEWLGRRLQFFESRDNKSWIALAGVDVEDAVGPSRVKVRVFLGVDSADFSRTVEVHPARYRTTTLHVPPKFVQPGPDELKVIQADSEIKEKVFASSASEPLWQGNFRAPVNAAATDSFGTRRVFNGKLDSVHKGMDFRAREGTVVRAGNSGVVVLARPLYFEGNCVIIDHGLGLYTLSMHFSRIDVHEGEHVVKGQRLGLSGATGRVTGPHLHWAVRWQGAYLDPAKLLRMKLDAIH